MSHTMRVVLWTAGGQPFAVPTDRVREVVPLLEARPIPRAAAWVLGLVNHRGNLVPLVDMARLLGYESREPRMCSRILIVSVRRSGEPESETMGLVVEAVLGSQSVPFPSAPEAAPGDNLLGPVALTEQGTVQWIEIDRIPIPAPPTGGTVTHGTDPHPN